MRNIFRRWHVMTQRPLLFEELENRVVFDASVVDPTANLLGHDLYHSDDLPGVQEAAGNATEPLEAVLISDHVQNAQALAEAVVKDAQVIVYHSEKDDLATVDVKLANLVSFSGRKIEHQAVVDSGVEGVINVGKDHISAQNAAEYTTAPIPIYRFGKLPPKLDDHTLRFENYLTLEIDPPPDSDNVLERVYKNLNESDPRVLFPIDANDQYGDCTIAALAHAETTFRGLLGQRNIMAEQKCVDLYLQLTGGSDNGLSALDVLNYWSQNVVSGDEIIAYASIDPKNHTHIQEAIHLFGGVYLGFVCQENCLEEFNSGQPWTPGPLTKDGHAVFAVAYDSNGVTVLTWGNVQEATWAWWDECVDEAYAILPAEAHDPNFAPGFNFEQLKTDLTAVKG